MLEKDDKCILVDGESLTEDEQGGQKTSQKSPQYRATTKLAGMSAEELGRYCFPGEFSLLHSTIHQSVHCWAPLLNNNGSDRTVLQKLEETSVYFRSQIMTKLKVSRSGRDLQRWLIDAESEERTRLVSGTLPIMQNGNILLVSSRRKEKFVLPKGGWETDETIEQSALRETFEEAGIWGILGAPFDPVIYQSSRSHQQSTNDQKHGSLGKTLEYSKVKLVIYPLFVKEIKDQWPESFRKRKVFTAEEAMSELAERPEFQAAVNTLHKHIEQT